MTAAKLILKYLSSRKSSLQFQSSSSENQAAAVDNSNSNTNRSRPRPSTASTSANRSSARRGPNQRSTTTPRRRLQRGWWPDAEKRAEQGAKAMEDLRDETYVVTDEHFEWVFDETKSGALGPQCHLTLPSKIATNPHAAVLNGNCRTSNECAICMEEYDLGDVVIHSQRCSHAFHQDCILDWFSRENADCPSCRATFWVPKNRGEKTNK